jgi:serine/threonine protein kinase
VATGNFSEEKSLGAGAFGQVFRGDLRDRRMPPVAVKRLMTPTLERTRRDYVTEITTLGQLSHRNLVKLIGWCDGGGRDNYLFLVYELVTNQSLDKHLHEDGAELAWPERYKVVLGVGTAIDYLHTGYRNPILHRDIKPSNVMLDDEFEAKLGDFGLVRPVSTGQGSLRDTTMVGSWGYMDPRCITTGTVSTASDIYSFGVLLLEVATGEEPVVVPDEESGLFPNTLVDAVRRSYARGAVLEMADDRLNGEFDMAQMERVLRVGLLCVQEDRGSRPGIKDVLNLLSNIKHPLPQVTTYP